MDLEKSRKIINEIDKEMTELFEKRMDATFLVAKYKVKNNLPIFDKDRERIVIENNTKHLKNPKYSLYLKKIYSQLMDVSKEYQKTIFFAKKRVGYQGVQGSFGQMAATFFTNNTDSSLLAYKEFSDIFTALDNNEIDYGVLPAENSSTGIINQNYDLLQKSRCYISAEVVVRANQNLLGIKGSSLKDIKKVYSHIQGFEQSRIFLKDYKNWELIPYYNTATSAKYVSEQNNISLGAIASVEAAEIYNLEVLQKNINDNSNNFTRFIKISKELEYDNSCDKISLVFSIKNERNSLLSILSILSDHEINMLNLQSRPVQSKPWEYLFYLDISGNLDDEGIKKCLEIIKDKTLYYRLLGCYRREVF